MSGETDVKTRVLFLCTYNSARSQMAEGLLRHLQGDMYEVCSAGTELSRVHPLAVQVMREIGIDISKHRSKTLSEFEGQVFDIVVTLCDSAHAQCPYFRGGKKMLHRSFADPTSGDIGAFRKCRDDIYKWLEMGDPFTLTSSPRISF